MYKMKREETKLSMYCYDSLVLSLGLANLGAFFTIIVHLKINEKKYKYYHKTSRIFDGIIPSILSVQCTLHYKMILIY